MPSKLSPGLHRGLMERLSARSAYFSKKRAKAGVQGLFERKAEKVVGRNSRAVSFKGKEQGRLALDFIRFGRVDPKLDPHNPRLKETVMDLLFHRIGKYSAKHYSQGFSVFPTAIPAEEYSRLARMIFPEMRGKELESVSASLLKRTVLPDPARVAELFDRLPAQPPEKARESLREIWTQSELVLRSLDFNAQEASIKRRKAQARKKGVSFEGRITGGYSRVGPHPSWPAVGKRHNLIDPIVVSNPALLPVHEAVHDLIRSGKFKVKKEFLGEAKREVLPLFLSLAFREIYLSEINGYLNRIANERASAFLSSAYADSKLAVAKSMGVKGKEPPHEMLARAYLEEFQGHYSSMYGQSEAQLKNFEREHALFSAFRRQIENKGSVREKLGFFQRVVLPEFLE